MTPRNFLLALQLVLPAWAQFPDGYVDEEFLTGLDSPVAFVHDANGQMYLMQRAGEILVVQDGVLASRPLLDISEEVAAFNDLGMLGMVLDPEFLTNGYIYLSYVVDRHHLLFYGTPQYDPDANLYYKATIGRLTRYTVDPATGFTSVVDGSRTVLLGESATSGVPALHWGHGIGGLAFGADGTLLLGAGDGASWFGVDAGSYGGTYYADGLADGIIRPAENVGAFRAQLLNSLSGKILRLDPATGDGLPSNPFYDPLEPRAPRSRVWALGSRNPFRLTVRPGTGQTDPGAGDPGALFVGDVGWNGFEELHVVDQPGMNLGWPLFEGLSPQVEYQATLTANLDTPNPLYDGATCTQEHFYFQDLLAQEREDHDPDFPQPCNGALEIPTSTPTFMHRRSQIEWRHNLPPRANVPAFAAGLATKIKLGTPACPVHGESFGGGCSIGGVWLSGLGFGRPYNGLYYFADFNDGWIRALEVEDDGTFHEVFEFGAAQAPTFLGEDPSDGSLLYTQFYLGSVRRVRFTGDGNVDPQVVAGVDHPYGSSARSVRLDATSSFDPEGHVLQFLWEFEDGTSTTNPSPLVTFANPGGAPAQQQVVLSVTDPSGATGHGHLQVHLDNTPPVVAVTGVSNGDRYSTLVETPFTLTAVATDAEHAAADLSYDWQVFLHHSNHWHPDAEHAGSSANIVLAPTPCAGEFYAYRVVLTVSDAEGLATTETLWFFPDCSFAGSAEVVAPTTGAVLDPGVPTTVEVATTGVVSRVDLYRDGVFAGSSFTPPYTFPWTPDEIGTTVLAAVAHVVDEGLVTSQGVPLVVRAPAVARVDVARVGNDAQESKLDGDVERDRPVLPLGMAGAQPLLIGVRLVLDVPPGAHVVGAHLQFTASAVDTGLAHLTVRAEATDDAPAMAGTSHALSSRRTTAAQVTWLAEPWSYVGARGWRERTPDLAALVQELVDRPGWQSGNHVLLLVDGFGRRRARAFTSTGTDAPRLVVEFAD